MDDVEAARAEPEVARLGVDDRPRRRPRPAPTRAASAQAGRRSPPTSTVERVDARRPCPRRSFSIASLASRRELDDRLADGEHLDDPRGGDALRRGVVGLGAVGEQDARRSRARSARSRRCRRRSPPRAARSRSARAPSRASRDRRRSSSAGGSRERPRSRRRRRRSRARWRPRCRRRASPRSPRRPSPRRASAPRPRPGSCRRRRSRPPRPSITPTFAVVSSSRRPSVIAPIAAAAASIAEWPSSGRMPACASSALELGDQPLVGRRRGDHLADRASRGRARSRTASAARRGRAPWPRAGRPPRRP